MGSKSSLALFVLLTVTGISKSSYYEPGFGYVNDPGDVFDYDYNDYKFEGEPNFKKN